MRTVRRMLGEVAVVTVGILLAFALDAWWDGRLAVRQEQQAQTVLARIETRLR